MYMCAFFYHKNIPYKLKIYIYVLVAMVHSHYWLTYIDIGANVRANKVSLNHLQFHTVQNERKQKIILNLTLILNHKIIKVTNIVLFIATIFYKNLGGIVMRKSILFVFGIQICSYIIFYTSIVRKVFLFFKNIKTRLRSQLSVIKLESFM